MTCQIFLLALQKDTLAAAKLYDNIGHLYIYMKHFLWSGYPTKNIIFQRHSVYRKTFNFLVPQDYCNQQKLTKLQQLCKLPIFYFQAIRRIVNYFISWDTTESSLQHLNLYISILTRQSFRSLVMYVMRSVFRI